ncbi:hypothetical protein V1477_003536 [Vespula maculifrons]|uniref:Uncharacterized protein n=1 Tax=Vespula maculifrons TaxID=7453 RepID=A0ABD2CT20_VESMC
MHREDSSRRSMKRSLKSFTLNAVPAIFVPRYPLRVCYERNPLQLRNNRNVHRRMDGQIRGQVNLLKI